MGPGSASNPGTDGLLSQLDQCSINDFSPTTLYASLGLDPSQKEIRLLEIKPGKGDERIRCSLFCTQLSPVPDYVALSYTWESTLPLVDVEINNVRMTIRRNLCEAFLRLRSNAVVIRVWADAICIDQSSIPERNSQVPLMKDIYLSASQVCVWLGEGTDATDLAIEALQAIAAASPTWSGPEALIDGLESWVPNRPALPKGLQAPRGGELLGLLKSGLNDIASRRWFNRVWVIQEMALPISAPLLLCGRSSICWDCFNISQIHLRHHITETCRVAENADYLGLNHTVSLEDKLISLFLIRTFVGGSIGAGWGDNLALAVGYSRYAEATDSRDKVYGLLGFAEPEAVAAIRVDYRKPVLDVYTEATEYFLANQRLSAFAWSGMAPTRAGWPSWVVDFEWHSPAIAKPVLPELRDPGTAYSTWPGRISPQFLPGRVLRLRGVVIDNVVHATPAICTTDSTQGDGVDCLLPDEVLKLFLQVGLPCESCLAKDPTEWPKCAHLLYFPEHATKAVPLRDAVWRLMVGDWVDPLITKRDRDSGPTPRKYQDVFLPALREMKPNWELLKQLGFDAQGEVLGGDSEEMRRDINLVTSRVAWFLNNKHVFQSAAGWIGVGFGDIQFGDYIVAVVGGDVPLVLRPARGGFALVGLSFVEGLMFGELLKMPRFRSGTDLNQSIRVRDFDIR
jgi:hypothetical protein